jgi:RNA polymerase sigma factor (sigma-70 family)
VHDFLCTANGAALTTYNIGRTQTETIKRRLKKIVAVEAHCTATRAICAHNLGYTWLEKSRHAKDMTEFDEELHGPSSPTPEALAIAGDNRERLTHALKSLPPRYREVIVLRELEGCSYKEIAIITSIPIGTVMSTLSRARRQLQLALADPTWKEATREL